MTNCCLIDTYDGEVATVYSARVVKARAEHQCDECHGAIRKGSLYEIAKGLWGGRWETYKTCNRCFNVRTEFFRGGFIHGEVVEHFHGCFGFDYRDGIPDGFTGCKDNRGAA